MPSTIAKQAYRFLKVEEFFDNYKSWETLSRVLSHTYSKDDKSLAINFGRNDGSVCSMRLQFPMKRVVRVRFDPMKRDASDHTDRNSRAVVQDYFSDLTSILQEKEPFQVLVESEDDKHILLRAIGEDGEVSMKVFCSFDPFSITVCMPDPAGRDIVVWQTAETPIYFTPNGTGDYSVIQCVRKPATAKYIGFGEQGGETLRKNGKQSNFFNFDNMRYRQIYDRGPLDPREPLYHSDPFFLEFNGVPGSSLVNATFIDNVGQVLVDTGFLNSGRYMMGTRYGGLDFYLFVGDQTSEIIRRFTSIVGTSRLKPRYCLGYHQGCYGYENRESLEWVVEKYRQYQIPLDGLHIDVDLQQDYHTFTVNEARFPDPKGMFDWLRGQGVKCSTNITPIISNRSDPSRPYQTYQEASQLGYFIADVRQDADDPAARRYQSYGGGREYQPNDENRIEGFNSGYPYIGEVYYGNDSSGRELGTPGHYADLARKDVRVWWGTQYQYLFDLGLEMVWQDMTTPAIRDCRGDMKGFPFRLIVTDDWVSDEEPRKTPAIKVWNLYSYNLHKATYHGLNHLERRDGKRNFIIGRGCFTGSQRWAGLWTGDNASDWDFLRMNVSQVLSLGMCGLNICGQDIGGFECGSDNGKWASPELLIRWTAAGAFLPWFRNHYVRKGRKEFQEPFMYVEWFEQYRGGEIPEPRDLYQMVMPVCKHYIELRYRLMQLFYDAMFANTIDGMPICRPLFINDPGDLSLFNDNEEFLDNEFFVGKDMLVAPVLMPQSEHNNNGRRDIYLPSGNSWYCFMDNRQPLAESVEGGTTIRDFDARLEGSEGHIPFIVPTYIRAGAIIPTIELEQYVGQRNAMGQPNPVTLNIYPGSGGTYTMYLDDGVSRSSAIAVSPEYGGDPLAEGKYRQVRIEHRLDGNVRTIDIVREHDGYAPEHEKYYFVALLHDPGERIDAAGCLKSIQVGGNAIARIEAGSVQQRRDALVAMQTDGWYFDETIRTSFVKIMDALDRTSVTIAAEYYDPGSVGVTLAPAASLLLNLPGTMLPASSVASGGAPRPE